MLPKKLYKTLNIYNIYMYIYIYIYIYIYACTFGAVILNCMQVCSRTGLANKTIHLINYFAFVKTKEKLGKK